MSLRTSPWPAGVPGWADLSVPDVPAATAFDSAVLGWSFTQPDEEFGGYVLGCVRGAAAAGIGRQHEPDAWITWTVYMASDDADATARTTDPRATEQPDRTG